MAGRWRTGGGGFLNGSNGVITGVKFGSKEWTIEKGPKKGETYHTFSAELTVRPDGAAADVQQFIPCGFFYPANQTISDDGTTLGSENDVPVIQGDSEFARFIDSMVEADASIEAELDPNYFNFSAIVGKRVTFKRVVDEQGTKDFGKRVAKKGKHKGKEFNRDFLTVSAVLGTVKVDAKGQVKAGAKAASAKAAPKAAAATAEADSDRADTLLLQLIGGAKDGTVARDKIGPLATRQSLMPDYKDMTGPARQALVKLVSSEGYLNEAVARLALADNDGVLSVAA